MRPPCSRCPMRRAAVLGVATIRGGLVTVYDPRPLLSVGGTDRMARRSCSHGTDAASRWRSTTCSTRSSSTEGELRRRAAARRVGRSSSSASIRRGDELIAVLDADALLDRRDGSDRRRTANERENGHESATVVKLVTFRLGNDLFAADITSVERVLRYAAPNTVPDAPAWVEGVLEHRGKVIPVVDMRRRIELAGTDDSDHRRTRILVLTTADGWVGAIVDAVLEVAIGSGNARSSAPPPLFRGLVVADSCAASRRCATSSSSCSTIDRVLTSADRLAFEGALDARRQSGGVRRPARG